jgi:predicted SnoaL-like aldol condensation-catalyzing enzyme
MRFSAWFGAVALSVTLVVGAQAGPLEEANKTIVREFYEMAFRDRQPTKAAQTYIGDKYIQHNPRVPNGAAPFYGFFENYLKQNPQSSSTIKRIVAENDLVVLHVHAKTSPEDRGRAIIDIFRVENGKIVEHWDVIQEVPERTANGNTMFDGSKSD